MREENNQNVTQTEDSTKKNPLPELKNFEGPDQERAAPPDIVIEN